MDDCVDVKMKAANGQAEMEMEMKETSEKLTLKAMKQVTERNVLAKAK